MPAALITGSAHPSTRRPKQLRASSDLPSPILLEGRNGRNAAVGVHLLVGLVAAVDGLVPGLPLRPPPEVAQALGAEDPWVPLLGNLLSVTRQRIGTDGLTTQDGFRDLGQEQVEGTGS